MPGTYDFNTTTLATLLEDPAARAVFDEVVPGMLDNPMLGMAKGMTLGSLLGMAGPMIGADAVEQLRERIAAL